MRSTARLCFTTILLLCAGRIAAAAAEEFETAETGGTTPATSWVQISSAIVPAARSYMAMTYDADSGKVLMFGGYDGAKYHHDTWAFDGSKWEKLSPVTFPPARAAAQMAYDAHTHRVVLFGGYDGDAFLGDTWIWNGATLQWHKATPQHSPGKLTGPMLFTDPNGSVDNIGGFDGQFYRAAMWQWTGSNWKQLDLPNLPTARSAAAVAVNRTSNRVVMFGGLAEVNPVNTWVYDGTTWKEEHPMTQPLWVYAGSGLYQPTAAHGKALIFGGANGGEAQQSTWRWLGTTWRNITGKVSPPAREGAGSAFDVALGRSIIFGGQNKGAYFNDTWVLTP